jgi:hypothetical protein
VVVLGLRRALLVVPESPLGCLYAAGVVGVAVWCWQQVRS